MQAFLGSRLLAAIHCELFDAYAVPDESQFDRYEIVLEVDGVVVARIGCLKEFDGPSVSIGDATHTHTVFVAANAGMPGDLMLFCNSRAETVAIARALKVVFAGIGEIARTI